MKYTIASIALFAMHPASDCCSNKLLLKLCHSCLQWSFQSWSGSVSDSSWRLHSHGSYHCAHVWWGEVLHGLNDDLGTGSRCGHWIRKVSQDWRTSTYSRWEDWIPDWYKSSSSQYPPTCEGFASFL